MSEWSELTLLQQLCKKGCPDTPDLKSRAAARITELQAVVDRLADPQTMVDEYEDLAVSQHIRQDYDLRIKYAQKHRSNK